MASRNLSFSSLLTESLEPAWCRRTEIVLARDARVASQRQAIPSHLRADKTCRHSSSSAEGTGAGLSAPVRRVAQLGRLLALVEPARQTLLAAFLVDEGRLAAFLAEIADGLPAGHGRRRVTGGFELADVLGQRPGDRVGQ